MERSPLDQIVRHRLLSHDQLDLICGQHPGPHVDLRHFAHKTLADVKAPSEVILLLPQDDECLVADLVPLSHSHTGEKFPVAPKMDQPIPGVPGDTDVLPSRNRPRRDCEIPYFSAYVNGILLVIGLKNQEIVVLGPGGVREEGKGSEKRGVISQADGEVSQGMLKGGVQTHEGLVSSCRENEDLLVEIWMETKDISVSRGPA